MVCNVCGEHKERMVSKKRCADCKNKLARESRLNNIDIIRENEKTYRATNKDKIAERCKVYYHANKEKLTAYQKKHLKDNPEKYKEYRRKWEEKNIDRMREVRKITMRTYSKKPSQLEYQKNYRMNRKNTDPMFAAQSRYRSSINSFIIRTVSDKNGTRVSNKPMIVPKIMGCDYNTFCSHMEEQFIDGMDWSNYGKNGYWVMDHIYPTIFAKDLDQLKLMNNYRNLQPLPPLENHHKHSNFPWDFVYDGDGNIEVIKIVFKPIEQEIKI